MMRELLKRIQDLEARLAKLESRGRNPAVPTLGSRVMVNITDEHTKGGVYAAMALIPTPAEFKYDEAGTITGSELLTTGPECIVINFNEVNSDTHWLTHEDNDDETRFNGTLIGVHENGRWIVAINGFWGGPCVSPPPPPP